MKNLKIAIAFFGLCIIAISCNESGADKTAETTSDSTELVSVKTDAAQLKKEMQELETAWSNADNAGDVNAMAAFYADDAMSLANGKPMLVGKAAIKKDMEENMAKKPKGIKVNYEVMDVYGSDNYATEVGKATRTDSTGKAMPGAKYMAIWEKRNGKWLCIRDIYNEDAKAK